MATKIAAQVGISTAGAPIVGDLAPTVFINGAPVAVAGAAVTGHGLGPHAAPVLLAPTTNGTVYANGQLICGAGDLASCGDPIVAAGTVFIP